MSAPEAQVLGWTVDELPCATCREIEYGIRVYVQQADGTINSLFFCGQTPWVEELMRRVATPVAS